MAIDTLVIVGKFYKVDSIRSKNEFIEKVFCLSFCVWGEGVLDV